MFALLKKNFRHQYSLGGALMVVIAIGTAVLDANLPPYERRLPHELLFALCFGMGCFGSLAAFTVDQLHEHDRFLDYLPVKRAHVWLANYFEPLFFVMLASVSLLGYRALFPVDGEEHVFVSGLALAFSVHACGAFFRACSRRLSVSAVLGAGAPFGALIVVAIVIAAADMHPSVYELAPVLALGGVFFTIAGYFVYTTTPPHVEQLGHALRAVGIAAFASVLVFVALFAGLDRWKKLEPGSEDIWVGVVQPIEGDPDHLLARVRGSRSGDHTVRFDLRAPGEYEYLGRYLEWPSDRRALSAPGHLLPETPRFRTVDGQLPLVDTRDRFGIFESSDVLQLGDARIEFPPHRKWQRLVYVDRDLVVFVGANEVLVLDHHGTVVRRIDYDLRGEVWAGSSRRLLAPAGRRPVVMDLSTGEVRELEGMVIAADASLDRVALLKGGRSVSVLELGPEGRERELVSAESVEGVLQRPPVGEHGRGRRAVFPPVVFDSEMKHALFTPERLLGASVETSIESFDVARAEKRTVVPAGDIPFARALTSGPVVHALSDDAAVVELDGRLELIDLAAGGARSLIIAGVSPSDTLAVSPSLQRIARREPGGIAIYERSGESTSFAGEDGAFFWLDDRRLVVQRSSALMIHTIDPKSSVQLFPPAR